MSCVRIRLMSYGRKLSSNHTKRMYKEIKSSPKINSYCSGSTIVTIVKQVNWRIISSFFGYRITIVLICYLINFQGKNLFMGKIGDSRPILGYKDIDGSLVAIQLTVDLKPDLPREATRIKCCKGRVFGLEDEPEVARVWLRLYDAPGLAMARAFGDLCVKDYGVISEPEFTHRTLTKSDQFLVLATDGVYNMLGLETD